MASSRATMAVQLALKSQQGGDVSLNSVDTPSARRLRKRLQSSSEDSPRPKSVRVLNNDGQSGAIEVTGNGGKRLRLSNPKWGLPNEVVRRYATNGVSSMFEWQADCLQDSATLNGDRNLLVQAPTSAGKTLIAEVLATRHCLGQTMKCEPSTNDNQILQLKSLLAKRKRKVLFVFPFISLAREKMMSLQGLLSSSGVRVGGLMGSYTSPGGLDGCDVCCCTIEKANSLLNSLIRVNSRHSALNLNTTSAKGGDDSTEEDEDDDQDVGRLVKVLLSNRSKAKRQTVKSRDRRREALFNMITADEEPSTPDMKTENEDDIDPVTYSTLKLFSKIGCLIVDELHLLGDSGRGHLLELMLTKLLFLQRRLKCKAKEEATLRSVKPIQIIAMSATMPNVIQLSQWLDARIVSTEFRPVPLHQRCKVSSSIREAETLSITRTLAKVSDRILPNVTMMSDNDHILTLVCETITTGCGVLIFCSTRHWSETLSLSIATDLGRLMSCNVDRHNDDDNALISAIKRNIDQQRLYEDYVRLKQTPVGCDDVLRRTLPFGVAFHHAGLTMDERDVIEDSFKAGRTKCLVATTTLASGVNLPARRVILRSINMSYVAGQRGAQVVDPLSYKQMIGRAGRQGVDTEGEAIVICANGNELKKVQSLATAELPPVLSSLLNGANLSSTALPTAFKKALLEAVANGTANMLDDIADYMKCTLLVSSNGDDNALLARIFPPNGINTQDIGENQDSNASGGNAASFSERRGIILNCLSHFVSGQLLRIDADGAYQPTQFGLACLSSSLSPDDAVVVLDDIQRCLKYGLVLYVDLHLVYICTPVYSRFPEMDWSRYMFLWESLSDVEKRIGHMVGVTESYIAKGLRGGIRPEHKQASPAHRKQLMIHLRFYSALILHDLVCEVPVRDVCKKYGCDKGYVQSLQLQASSFAAATTIFCKHLGHRHMAALIAAFDTRLAFGVQPDLVDLMRLKCMSSTLARGIQRQGVQSVKILSRLSPQTLEQLLVLCRPFLDDNVVAENNADAVGPSAKQPGGIFLADRQGLIPERAAAEIMLKEAKDFARFDDNDDEKMRAKVQRRAKPKSILKSAPSTPVGTPRNTSTSSRHPQSVKATILNATPENRKTQQSNDYSIPEMSSVLATPGTPRSSMVQECDESTKASVHLSKGQSTPPNHGSNELGNTAESPIMFMNDSDKEKEKSHDVEQSVCTEDIAAPTPISEWNLAEGSERPDFLMSELMKAHDTVMESLHHSANESADFCATFEDVRNEKTMNETRVRFADAPQLFEENSDEDCNTTRIEETQLSDHEDHAAPECNGREQQQREDEKSHKSISDSDMELANCDIIPFNSSTCQNDFKVPEVDVMPRRARSSHKLVNDNVVTGNASNACHNGDILLRKDSSPDVSPIPFSTGQRKMRERQRLLCNDMDSPVPAVGHNPPTLSDRHDGKTSTANPTPSTSATDNNLGEQREKAEDVVEMSSLMINGSALNSVLRQVECDTKPKQRLSASVSDSKMAEFAFDQDTKDINEGVVENNDVLVPESVPVNDDEGNRLLGMGNHQTLVVPETIQIKEDMFTNGDSDAAVVPGTQDDIDNGHSVGRVGRGVFTGDM